MIRSPAVAKSLFDYVILGDFILFLSFSTVDVQLVAVSMVLDDC